MTAEERLAKIKKILDSWAWTGGAMSSHDAACMYSALVKAIKE